MRNAGRNKEDAKRGCHGRRQTRKPKIAAATWKKHPDNPITRKHKKNK